MSSRVTITDHAVLRYLERACGVDVDALRRHISRRAMLPWPADRAALGAHALIAGGVRYHFRIAQDGCVVLTTVTACGDSAISKRAMRLRRKHRR